MCGAPSDGDPGLIKSDDFDLIVEYLKRYDPSVEANAAIIGDLVKKAMNYYRDFILPNKQYRIPSVSEKAVLIDLRNELDGYAGDDENELQSIPFAVLRRQDKSPADFFKLFYEVVFG